MLTPPSLQLCWFLIIPKEYKPTPLMLPQLSQLFHQHKKAFVSLSHFFYFIFFFYYKRHQQHFIVCNVATSLLPFKIPAALWEKNKKLAHAAVVQDAIQNMLSSFCVKVRCIQCVMVHLSDTGIFNEGDHTLKVQCDQLTNMCDEQDHQDSKPKIYTFHTIAILTVTL